MGDPGFEIKGLEEFQKKIKTIERKAPDRILRELDKQGNKLRREMRKNTPERKRNLVKGYRVTKSEKAGKGYQKGLYNQAPHHHLVNNGHKKVTRGGRVIGWTPGLFYVELTVSQQEGIIMADLQDWLEELYAELK